MDMTYSAFEPNTEYSKYLIRCNQDKLTPGDKSLDLSTFKLSCLFFSLLSSGVFDIVIGMDWLDKYSAIILCSQKLVRVVNPQGRKIVINGNKRKGDFELCSIMKAKKYLSRGCYAYIAHVIDTSFEKKSVEDVPIVNEFLDVFPEDFSGISPERQVEFQIDLIPRATPIAKTSYHLALSKMKKLMSQLQELLDKGFIPPSSSPWGEGGLHSCSLKRKMIVCECLAGYYWIFIQDFSKIASSPTKLTKKNTPFEWGGEQEEAFSTLRKKLCEASILVLPEGTEDMVVYSDASYSGLGCVLM
nr:putative reverse transcriptase domain-containing protein [Tanacetum cinerariifolium]